METRTSSSDLLFCPCILNPNELLEAVDTAWQPRDRDQDPDRLNMYQFDWISRFLVKSDDDEEFKRASDFINESSPYGPKRILCRLPKDRKKSGFEFESVFPKTYAMLTSGKFRWFAYRKGILRVIVGRGVGNDNRQFEAKQVLKTWKHEFESLHELLCAVEASWIWKGQEMTAETIIDEFDSDLGPSKPLPKEPATLGSEEDSVLIYNCNASKRLVTALAITEDPDGNQILYSGHDDGTLTKWSLESNTEIWSKQIYVDGRKDFGERAFCFHVQDTGGVSHIAVRPDPKHAKQHIVFTWSDAYNGYPECDFDDRYASAITALSGKDGSVIRQYCCDVGRDEEGNFAHPSIATVVFCKLFVKGSWVDSIVVGLHCVCNVLDHDESYSDFNLAHVQQFSKGNILPFKEHSASAMETWRGHSGLVRCMSVIDSYLLSFSIQPGHGFPDAFILWSLRSPGVPLERWDCWDPSQSTFRQMQTRLDRVCGMCADGDKILLADEDADRFAVLNIEHETIDLVGYGGIGSKYYDDQGFHGRMASFGTYAIMANECDPTVWLFKTKGCAEHKNLDRTDGTPDHFKNEFDDDEDALETKRAGREIAVGKLVFPKWGGTNSKKKAKVDLNPFAFPSNEDKDGLGEGGPTILSMRGKYVVAGFSNGAIARMQLPEEFNESSECSLSANHLSCSSYLPSDEWHYPTLECDDSDCDETEESADDEDDNDDIVVSYNNTSVARQLDEYYDDTDE
jgi:hypothetical protein